MKPQVEDILPQSGTAKRLVEQWSNIEALKTSQSAANVSHHQREECEAYDALFPYVSACSLRQCEYDLVID